ncbi:MAG TPA: hypothetical protein VM012_05690 [Flavitalea sp.]|nr:hypothetical protein [Flavitalea sp.]
MYVQVWNKYLPIIKILMKRAVTAVQTLDMNRIDFERAGSGRKAGYKFIIEFTKGRVANVISGSPLASDLALVMLQDPVVKTLFQSQDYKISLNTKFQLRIEHVPGPMAAQEATNSVEEKQETQNS